MDDVLAIILGGGQGTRLFPLTQQRSKPAVPIGGKYRLIDVPISNCLHADLRRIFVLTQFNSASLNRHVAQTYRMDHFSGGFVEILAAEQTPDNVNWFQGTADAVRRAARHFVNLDASHYLILAGDHLYRMDYARLIETHRARRADITIAAQPVSPDEAAGMGIFRFDADGHIVAFEEKPPPSRLAEIGRSVPPGSTALEHFDDRPFVASMGIYVFSRDALFHALEGHPGVDFGREILPRALGSQTVIAYLHDGYWVDVGTVASFYEANIALTRPSPAFHFYNPRRPIYTHARFLPGSWFNDCTIIDSIVSEGCTLDSCRVSDSVVGIRTKIGRGSEIRRSVLLGADFYEDEPGQSTPASGVPLGIGRDVVLEGVIVDKNARIADGVRLTNAARVAHADGPGYHIRSGIVIVPKGGVIEEGTTV
jgi:glucose-1-phosphate adenylyltransferase